MARGIRYPKGWPNTKRRDKSAKLGRSNLRAVAYLQAKDNRLSKG